MLTRHAVVLYGLSTTAAALVTLAVVAPAWRSRGGGPSAPCCERAAVVPAQSRRAVDVVFAVDTTGSMGGLIEGAKRTVWSIATHLRQAEPDADLRIGLVAYRDLGDEYVTRDFALTGDLDAVFAELSGYRAEGGGDFPEDVDAALDDTLHKMAWRAGARKLVFLVGDAPPASRGDVPRFDVLAREAGQREIVLNAIRCGRSPETEAAWRQIAQLGHGELSTIDQDGGVRQIATPYDAELAELSTRIDSTSVIVGDDGDRAGYARGLAAASMAPAPAKADRASYYAKGRTARSSKDALGKIASGEVALEKIAPAELPAELRAMDRPQLEAEIARRAAVRQQAQAELSAVAKKRDDYLRSQAATGEGGFDAKVKAAIDAQLK
jgi:hypothetical protein